jgi:hypothetical protein
MRKITKKPINHISGVPYFVFPPLLPAAALEPPKFKAAPLFLAGAKTFDRPRFALGPFAFTNPRFIFGELLLDPFKTFGIILFNLSTVAFISKLD